MKVKIVNLKRYKTKLRKQQEYEQKVLGFLFSKMTDIIHTMKLLGLSRLEINDDMTCNFD